MVRATQHDICISLLHFSICQIFCFGPLIHAP
jgi:hypothetical protein